jgi:hypothetical protein
MRGYPRKVAVCHGWRQRPTTKRGSLQLDRSLSSSSSFFISLSLSLFWLSFLLSHTLFWLSALFFPSTPHPSNYVSSQFVYDKIIDKEILFFSLHKSRSWGPPSLSGSFMPHVQLSGRSVQPNLWLRATFCVGCFLKLMYVELTVRSKLRQQWFVIRFHNCLRIPWVEVLHSLRCAV